jgi:enterochelin esterase-like enzyme
VKARALTAAAVAAAGIAAAVLAADGHGHAKVRALSRATIAYGSFHSVALRDTDHYSIYLPPGYRGSKRRYPVVYFLHGLPESSDAYRSIGAVAQAVQRSGHQAIVVGAQGARDSDPDPEWLDRGPGENWETATAVELVHAIDRRYRTIASRAGRVLIGISAGGYGAMLIGSHHPDTYSVIESWSGYFHPTDPAGTAPLDLGSEAANDWADFHKLIPTLEDMYGKWWRSTWFAFYVGTNDTRFRDENEQTYRELRAAGAPHLTFAVYRGGHDWGLWQRHAPGWVRLALSAAAKPR